MEIKRAGSQPSGKGPSDWFIGTVRIDPLFQAPDPALVQGASVTFEPGARTAWHTHPLGQTLIVTAGCGRAQRWGGPIEEIRPGDVVWFSPGEKHWHGATPTTAMTHIAIQEKKDGKVVDWMEHVSDEQYPAWRLAWLEEPDASGKVQRADCTGLLVYTRDGHMSVQVMYRNPQPSQAGPVQYATGGYEASYGTYTINDAHTFTFHVEGALVRKLVGKDLKRVYERSGKQMIVKSPDPNERWRVAWERN